MMKMQTELWEKHKDKWPPMQPEHGKDFILWMIEEIGEVISIIKKKSIHDIMDDPAVHSHFVEESAMSSCITWTPCFAIRSPRKKSPKPIRKSMSAIWEEITRKNTKNSAKSFLFHILLPSASVPCPQHRLILPVLVCGKSSLLTTLLVKRANHLPDFRGQIDFYSFG